MFQIIHDSSKASLSILRAYACKFASASNKVGYHFVSANRFILRKKIIVKNIKLESFNKHTCGHSDNIATNSSNKRTKLIAGKKQNSPTTNKILHFNKWHKR